MAGFLERAGAMIPCLPVFAIPAWSVWRLVRGFSANGWKRPGWFGHAAWASFVIGGLVWLWGAAVGGLSTRDACRFRHQSFDDVYHEANRDDYFRLYPLTRKCNASYDLVPAWVNPTVAVFLLLFVISTVGIVWTAAPRVRQASRANGSGRVPDSP